MIYDILGRGSLRLDSEDSLYDIIRRGIETNREMFGLLEFVRFEYCSTAAMNDFLELLSEHSYEINASMWAGVRARLALPVSRILSGKVREFPPLVKKGKIRVEEGWQRHNMTVEIDVPDGIIAHLTRECGGNVHDRKVVEVTCGSFEKESHCASLPWVVGYSTAGCAAKNVADLETDSIFHSAYRDNSEDIPHTRNNWICYDFKERRIVPTHYTIRTYYEGPGWAHLKSWLVETSVDGKNWREVAREEDNRQLNGDRFTATFAVADGGECRFIRLVNIGRNHNGNDLFAISAWEIFGSLIE
jgi:hypothetical protein